MKPTGQLARAFAPQYSGTVKDTKELRRVLGLPRRSVSLEDDVELREELERLLRTDAGTMKLRPIQAQALYDIGATGGLFGPIRVGAGKTLISFLAGRVTFSSRPALLVPAKLVDKTRRELVAYSAHWEVVAPRIMTYEWLGRVQGADALNLYQPDLIIADECHKLKNRKAAVTRRVYRWFRDNPTTKCVAMSGTITKRSLHDYAHILQWVFGPQDYPLPVTYPEREDWADAIDGRKDQKYKYPGALRLFCNDEESEEWEKDAMRAARRAYRRRLVTTPGVVATTETPIDATLTIQHIEPRVPKSVDDAFDVLRTDWETPDGWPLADRLEMFRHSRELALGFFYKWDPRPPLEWLEPRKAWCKFVREKINKSNKYDSELQVRQAFKEEPLLVDWLNVKNMFSPNTVPVWLDHFIVDVVLDWVTQNKKGIIWTEHRCVGHLLEDKTGITYYGRRGLSSAGRSIEDHPKNEPFIASQQSNSEGRNLQNWCRNLILSMPPNGLQIEQLLGRTHRDGQQSDEVSVEVVLTCAEHLLAFWQAKTDAEYVQDSTGSPQKLLLADVNVLPKTALMERVSNSRWRPPSPPKDEELVQRLIASAPRCGGNK